MNFKPTQKLEVVRTLQSGAKVPVGVLAQNKQGVFFQYDQHYLNHFHNVSPFTLDADRSIQPAPKVPHAGLHGVFADALPDGWGLLLQDRIFRQHGILPANITAMDRLALVGGSALGALSFSPVSEYTDSIEREISFDKLGLHAQAIFDGQTEDILAELVATGSSGGARPKAQLYFKNGNIQHCRTIPGPDDEAWLVKFTSAKLALGHEEGLCEAAYLSLAGMAGLNPPQWTLLDAPQRSGAKKWLALKRFDYIHNPNGLPGRLHLHSACGLLDADFRAPSLDYEDLIKASSILCKSPAVGQLQFKRALFNLLVCNQDDHSKNWAFLQNDKGEWQPAPFYDVTFSPHPFAEHATSFAGFGKQPPLNALQKLADAAGFARWSIARQSIKEMIEVITEFSTIANNLGVNANTTTLINRQLLQSCKNVSDIIS